MAFMVWCKERSRQSLKLEALVAAATNPEFAIKRAEKYSIMSIPGMREIAEKHEHAEMSAIAEEFTSSEWEIELLEPEVDMGILDI